MRALSVTAKKFTAATGHKPEGDDLERCNCKRAGEMGHWSCGWDADANLPVFLTDRPMRPSPHSTASLNDMKRE
jgi:hypothetical protein